jgi:hypothetical protein
MVKRLCGKLSAADADLKDDCIGVRFSRLLPPQHCDLSPGTLLQHPDGVVSAFPVPDKLFRYQYQ